MSAGQGCGMGLGSVEPGEIEQPGGGGLGPGPCLRLTSLRPEPAQYRHALLPVPASPTRAKQMGPKKQNREKGL